MNAPEGFRQFPRVRIKHDVNGWPVGPVGYYEYHEFPDARVWNEAGDESWCHNIGVSCEYTDEPCNILERGK